VYDGVTLPAEIRIRGDRAARDDAAAGHARALIRRCRYCGAPASCWLSCFVGRWFIEPAEAGGLTLLSAFAM